MAIIDHISLGVSDVAAIKPFYDAVMATLGCRLLATGTDPDGSLGGVGYGIARPDFWICTPMDGQFPQTPCNGTHVGFKAASEDAVRQFHAVALKHGGRDGGAPGVRPEYGPGYYAAFIFDPFGHKIEVVFLNDHENVK